MARPAKYPSATILDTARTLLLERGPSGITAQAVATTLNAPSGSIYHRFPTRDTLAASTWMRAVERFQAGLLEATGHDDPVQAVTGAALHVLTWSRTDLDDARTLMLFRLTDLALDLPADLGARDRAQRARTERFLADLYARCAISDAAGRRRVRFAAIDLPYAAVRPALLRAEPPEPDLDGLVSTAIRAVMTTPQQGG